MTVYHLSAYYPVFSSSQQVRSLLHLSVVIFHWTTSQATLNEYL
jgi:hypothetical protein